MANKTLSDFPVLTNLDAASVTHVQKELVDYQVPLSTLTQYVTENAEYTALGNKINGADEKTDPVDADMVGLMDSAASNVLKKFSWANFKAKLKTYFDALYLPGGVPPGTVLPYAGSTAPTYYLMCDGSAVSRTTYAALFAVIGTTFGTGDGSTTFNLPDLCGVFIKGAGTTDRAAGKDASGNYYSGTLGTYSTDQMQGHVHSLNNHTSVVRLVAGEYTLSNGAAATQSTLSVESPITDGTNGTPRTGHTTEPQSLGMNHIIKY